VETDLAQPMAETRPIGSRTGRSPSCLQEVAKPHPGWTGSLASAATEAKIQMFKDICGFKIPISHGLHQIDATARRRRFPPCESIRRTYRQTEATFDTARLSLL
jgi:hypothetical protein